MVMEEAPSNFLQPIPGKSGRRARHAEALGRKYQEDMKPGTNYFPPPHKLALLGVLLERLIWLHDQHLVIGDLQPSNILVTDGTDIREVYLSTATRSGSATCMRSRRTRRTMWDVGRTRLQPRHRPASSPGS